MNQAGNGLRSSTGYKKKATSVVMKCIAPLTGVGMVISLPEKEVETALALLEQAGEKAWVIGKIEHLGEGEAQVEIQ